MDSLFESRASIILYNVLVANFTQKDLFVLPANICPIVPATFMKSGVNFTFVDVSVDGIGVDDSALISLAEKGEITGVLYVRPYGFFEDKEVLFNSLKSINSSISIIDDRCLVPPSFGEPKSIADLILYSTGYSKFVDLGWGGYAYLSSSLNYETNDFNFEEDDHIALQNSFRQSLDDNLIFSYSDTKWLGGDLKMDFDEYNELVQSRFVIVEKHKLNVNAIYKSGLTKVEFMPDGFSNWRFNILVDNKEQLLKSIFDNNLFASSHYPSTSYMFKGVQSPNAEGTYKRIINLFNDFRVTEKDAIKMVKVIEASL